MLVAVVASLLAALLYAVASVLQHRAAIAVASELSMRLGLLTKLIAKPWWLAGVAADALAFALQFIALGHGPLVVVQPLLVSGLLFALPLGAWVSGGRIRAPEVRAALLVVVGLILLLILGNPSRGRAPSDSAWIVMTVATIVPVTILVIAAGRSPHRPVLLAVAAGWMYGYTAALADGSAHALNHGLTHALSTWQLWALLPGGLVGMVVSQSAFQAGPLKLSLPALTAVDPMVSIAIGVLAFHEHLSEDPLHLLLDVVGVAMMVAGVMILGRSPLIALEEPKQSERSTDGANHP